MRRISRLLLNILPKNIAERLKNGESNIADSFAQVTILFADIVGFTKLSQTVNPWELVSKLNDLFSRFDKISVDLKVEKSFFQKIKEKFNGMKKIVEWICSPETDSKKHGDYEKLSNEGLRSIMESILHRIDSYVNGESSIEVAKQNVHSEFKILRNENGWTLIESHDPHSLGAIWQSGFEKIALIRPQTDGSTCVTLAKKSDFIEAFPLKKLYNAFNKLEPGWGGGSTIGGSPRNGDGSRSKLTIEQIVEIIDETIEKYNKRLSKYPPK